jgi:hypothetical protein
LNGSGEGKKGSVVRRPLGDLADVDLEEEFE